MDTRLIFRDRSWMTKTATGAGRGRSSAPTGHGASKPAVRHPSGWTCEGWETSDLLGLGDSIEPGLQEKPALGSRERPYRKPTRVAGCESTKVDG